MNLRPKFSYKKCREEFEDLIVENITVNTYRSDHSINWVDATEMSSAAAIRECCIQPKSQHSIRQLDTDRFFEALSSTSPGLVNTWRASLQGHNRSQVKVRIGQREFRMHLLALYGEVCAVSGPHPRETLEAAHLYSYAATGEHHSHGGLLLYSMSGFLESNLFQEQSCFRPAFENILHTATCITQIYKLILPHNNARGFDFTTTKMSRT